MNRRETDPRYFGEGARRSVHLLLYFLARIGLDDRPPNGGCAAGEVVDYVSRLKRRGIYV